MIAQYCNKSRNVHGDKYLSRNLTKEVSRMLLLYLAVIRPFERYAIGVLNAHDANEKERKLSIYTLYLFVCNGELLTSPQMANHLARQSLKTLNVELRLNSYRHIVIAFMCVHIQHFINANQIDDIVD
ncbi:hypothetical protein PS15m_011546 [Mucor circinelloides]